MLKHPERKSVKADSAEGYALPDIALAYPQDYDGIWIDWTGGGQPFLVSDVNQGRPVRVFLIEYFGDGSIELIWMKTLDDDFSAGKELVYSGHTGFDKRADFPDIFYE